MTDARKEANRAAQRDAAVRARTLLLPLQIDEAATFSLPSRQPERRDVYLAIFRVAWRLWGRGGTLCRSDAAGLTIRRLPKPDPQVRQDRGNA